MKTKFTTAQLKLTLPLFESQISKAAISLPFRWLLFGQIHEIRASPIALLDLQLSTFNPTGSNRQFIFESPPPVRPSDH
jgi:hypothetical protein